MKVILDLCVVPMGVGVSVSDYVPTWERVIRKTGLDAHIHYDTNIEDEWVDVMAAVKRCHEMVHDMGAPRITTTELGTRTNPAQTMEDKVRGVEDKLTPDK